MLNMLNTVTVVLAPVKFIIINWCIINHRKRNTLYKSSALWVEQSFIIHHSEYVFCHTFFKDLVNSMKWASIGPTADPVHYSSGGCAENFCVCQPGSEPASLQYVHAGLHWRLAQTFTILFDLWASNTRRHTDCLSKHFVKGHHGLTIWLCYY